MLCPTLWVHFSTCPHDPHEQVVERITSFGKNVFGTATPEESIQAIHDFYENIGIPMTLAAVGIDGSRIDEMAHHIAVNEGLDQAWVPLYEEDIAAILRDCM